jgi:hypothetical protein
MFWCEPFRLGEHDDFGRGGLSEVVLTTVVSKEVCSAAGAPEEEVSQN